MTISSATSGESHTTGTPCENWKMLGSASNPKGYKYRDKENDDGTIKVAVWKAGKIKTVLKGKGTSTLDYDLTVALSQGEVLVLFDNNGATLCSACNPFSGKDGSDGKKYLAKDCATPVSCGP